MGIWIVICIQKSSYHFLPTFCQLRMFKIVFRNNVVGNISMTSNCDITSNTHQLQKTPYVTEWNPPWKFSAYATGHKCSRYVTNVGKMLGLIILDDEIIDWLLNTCPKIYCCQAVDCNNLLKRWRSGENDNVLKSTYSFVSSPIGCNVLTKGYEKQ